MVFSVESSARELMLEPEELEDIFEAFFEDAVGLMAEAEKSSQAEDAVTFCKRMHSLKGSALNLRMNVLGELAKQAERDGLSASIAQRGTWLQTMRTEIAAAQQVVNEYYR